MQVNRKNRVSGKALLFWTVLFFFFFDYVVFSSLLFRMPNETAWETQTHFNFEFRLKNANRREVPEFYRRIAVVGSSICLYSVLPAYLEERLKVRGLNAKVDLFCHQGLTPLHALAVSSRINRLDYDLIIYPVNSVDFRLERPNDITYFISSPEFQALAPGGKLRYFFSDMDFSAISASLFASVVNSYRYKDFVFPLIETYLSNRFSRGRSYHNYAGIPVGGSGVNWRGWTAADFEIIATGTMEKEGLYVQVPEQAQRLRIDNLTNGSFIEVDLVSGWQHLDLSEVALRSGHRIKFRMEGIYSEEFADTIGLRLSRNAGLDSPYRNTKGRFFRREDSLYRSYSDSEYIASFEQRILNFDRTGMEYLEALRNTKISLAGGIFDADFITFDSYLEFTAGMHRESPLFVVHGGENPISRAWYENSSWYEGFSEFLNVCKSSLSSHSCLYADFSTQFRMQEFYDYHHLTYGGAERFTELLADQIIASDILSDRR